MRRPVLGTGLKVRTSVLMTPAMRRKVRSLVPPLLRWFAANARDLPWRRTLDPYAIWISEIMLQQTQVKTVIPYWERWMRELPNVRALATARPEKVLKLWEGLGYYTRARNLQKAARQIVAEHHGRVPENFDEILALPGVGHYTAGAIASIAFNQPKPILDGNVIRVLTRLFGIAGDPREKSANQRLWMLAQNLVRNAGFQTGTRFRINAPDRSPALLSSGTCSLLNQSLMELGALVCTPRAPRCAVCPVRSFCAARRLNRVDALPSRSKRSSSVARRFVAFVVKVGSRFLVRQRPPDVVNAHLWEFPNLETTGTKITVANAANKILGVTAGDLHSLVTIRHSITRYRISLEVFSCETDGKSKTAGRWLRRGELDRLAFTSAHRRILQNIATNRLHRRRSGNLNGELGKRIPVSYSAPP